MSDNKKIAKDKDGRPIGLDLVNYKPDYTIPIEEDNKRYIEAYKKVFGEEPPGVDKE